MADDRRSSPPVVPGSGVLVVASVVASPVPLRIFAARMLRLRESVRVRPTSLKRGARVSSAGLGHVRTATGSRRPTPRVGTNCSPSRRRRHFRSLIALAYSTTVAAGTVAAGSPKPCSASHVSRASTISVPAGSSRRSWPPGKNRGFTPYAHAVRSTSQRANVPSWCAPMTSTGQETFLGRSRLGRSSVTR